MKFGESSWSSCPSWFNILFSGTLLGGFRQESRQAAVAIAETIQANAHQIHQRKKETAGAAIIVAFVEIIQHPAPPQSTARAARQHDRKLIRAVSVAIEQA